MSYKHKEYTNSSHFTPCTYMFDIADTTHIITPYECIPFAASVVVMILPFLRFPIFSAKIAVSVKRKGGRTAFVKNTSDYQAAFDTTRHRFLDESLTVAGIQPKIHGIVKAIYAEATWMVRLRLPSGETMCSEPFPVRRGVIQGDIFSPQCFTIGLDRIFRLHDIAGQGIGGPSLSDVTASKLEYADDVGLLDWTATEASQRVSALASGSQASASMEMSAPKSKGMHVHVRERLPVSTEVEVKALDFPHSCPDCEKSFPTTRGLAVHRARWCRPGQRPTSRRGQLADKAVKLAKREASATLLPPVVMEGESLESVCQFDYPLMYRFTSDGDDAAEMRHRMTIAGEGSRGLDHLWRDNCLPRSLKLRLYAASVCSTLTHGSEAWMLTPRALPKLNGGFNSRQPGGRIARRPPSLHTTF